ncbi:MAG: fatty acid desaturase [Acidobacteriota bacterium]|nr:fatty acid desaturase [Acidobacteriota bacterium]
MGSIESQRVERSGVELSTLRRSRSLNWGVLVGIGAMHVGSLLAPFFFTWSGLVVACFLYWVSGCLGVTIGYHRLLTHRSFKTPKWFEYFLTACACLAWQGGPVQWVGVHRIHHAHSDTDGDPHTPSHGFAWSHVFWCMFKEAEGRRAADAAKDLLRDRGLRFLDRHFRWPQLALMLFLFGAGELAGSFGLFAADGASWVVWGVFVRTVFLYHSTWFVNSASHTWGYRNFATDDNSTNLWWVSLLSFGEGWHNNHHAYQRSVAHGMRWFELDVSYLIIRTFSKMGLAWDLILPPVVSPSSSSS